MNLFEIAGEEFYFDIENICEYLKLDKKDSDIENLLKEFSVEEGKESTENTDVQPEHMPEESYGQMIDITKWELTKALIETILAENGDVDESMGITKLEKQLSIPFRISFNTLLINKLIKQNG